MTAQGGQRFRRRALRRGYKADEVDDFLERAEATLDGNPIGEPITAKQVHDVVFRVRFGGYDEWQVDVYLDRLERQLTAMEEHGGLPQPKRSGAPQRHEEPAFPHGGDRGFSQEWGMGADFGEPPSDYGPGRRVRYEPDYDQEPEREHPRAGMRSEPEDPRYGRLDEPPPGPRARPVPPSAGPPRPGAGQMPPPMPMPPPPHPGPPPMAPPGRASAPPPGRAPAPPPGRPPMPPPPGRPPMPDHGMPMPDRGMPDRGMPPQHMPPMPGGYEPGRHGKLDMTSEIRSPDSPFTPEDMRRLEQLRRTFQIRRFGSGYDRAQVDRLFDAIGATMVGRSAVRVADGELDPGQFSLVPGGYFEAEVDAALREVRDLFTQRGVTR